MREKKREEGEDDDDDADIVNANGRVGVRNLKRNRSFSQSDVDLLGKEGSDGGDGVRRSNDTHDIEAEIGECFATKEGSPRADNGNSGDVNSFNNVAAFRRRSSSCGLFEGISTVDSIREEDEEDLIDEEDRSRGSQRSRSVSIDEKTTQPVGM